MGRHGGKSPELTPRRNIGDGKRARARKRGSVAKKTHTYIKKDGRRDQMRRFGRFGRFGVALGFDVVSLRGVVVVLELVGAGKVE